jgi:sec-independent protein translocase protein TatB
MFDIGFWEMMLIGIVALVVIGPERLPAVARTLGRWTAKVRNFVANTRADIEKEFNSEEIRKLLDDKQGEINELRSMLNETRASIEQAKDQYIVRAIDDDEEKPSDASSETIESDTKKGDDGKA